MVDIRRLQNRERYIEGKTKLEEDEIEAALKRAKESFKS